MKSPLKTVLIIATGVVAAVIFALYTNSTDLPTPTTSSISSDVNSHEGPLQKYSLPNLRDHEFTPSDITLGSTLDLNVTPTTYQFFFTDNYAPDKKISGTIMLPSTPNTYPAIIMLRGWADEEVFVPGYGTKNAAAYFAQRGFITIAPDYLGYGDSDSYADDFAEARFQTYTATLTLLNSLDNLSNVLPEGYRIDSKKVGMWGHSNGGQIALTTLAVTKETIPTTLWAPVTIPFPANILHFAGDQEDGGRLLRDLVAGFVDQYDASEFTPTSYLADITAPILLHQGSADDSVPQEWNDEFARLMEELGMDLTYYVYPGADHNMRPQWDTVIARDTAFFDEHVR